MSDMLNGKSTARKITRRDGIKIAAAASLFPFIARTAQAQDAKTIKLAQIQALTGPSAEHGIRARDGAIYAAEELNKSLGAKDKAGRSYKLELVDSDMANDPRQAITLLRNYAADPSVMCVLGPTNSVGFLPMTPVAAQFKIPVIGNGSGASIKEWNDWVYRVNPTSAVATPALIQKVVEKHKAKRVAIIYDQTQEVQAGDAAICRRVAAEFGYTIVSDEAYKSGDQDFSAQITKVKFSKADALFLAAAPGDGAKAAAQIAEAGVKLPMMTGFGAFQDPVYWDNSGGTIKGGYTWIAQDLGNAGGALAQWTKLYSARFRLEATIQSAFGYDSVYAFVAALKECSEPSRDQIHSALTSLKATTPIGTTIEFKNPPSGDNLKPTVTIIEVTGRGAYKPV
jgi:branched-chain amino acid transport system substrate-binding protein